MTGFDRQTISDTTAKILLEVQAVHFNAEKPFIFTSGWASPVYIDCRKLISYPRVRRGLMEMAEATILRDVGYEQIDAVAGGETAGIPFAAWIADRMMLPMQYVRKKPKGFGRNAQIEGHLEEGSRVLLVEIQSLTVPAKSGISRIYSDRIDAGRVARMAAVLEKHLGLHLAEHDLYVNVAGGIRIAEVGVELSLALALYSARTGVTLPAATAVTGEVSLTGEVRPVPGVEKRARACRDMGFRTLIGPGGAGVEAPETGRFDAVEMVRDAVRLAFAQDRKD